MQQYYLEKEKHYWLKVLCDGLLLFGSFLVIYFIKRGNFKIGDNFKKYLLVLFIVWLVTTLLSKKFMQGDRSSYFELLSSYIYPFLATTATLTVVMYLLGWYKLSRFIVYGSLCVFVVLEVIVFSFIFLFKKGGLKREPKQFSVIFFLIEIIFIIATFIFIYILKRGTLRLKEPYQILLMGIFFAWLLVSLLIHKFNIKKTTNYLKTILPFLKSEITLISLISFFIFFFKLAKYSRSVILGSLGLFSLLELAIVSFYFVYTKPKSSDEDLMDFSSTQLIDDDRSDEPAEGVEEEAEVYDPPRFALKTISIDEKLKDIYLKKYKSLYKYIKDTINLNKIDILKAEVLNTRTLYNLEILEDKSLTFLLNLHKINDFRRINEYFICINRKLKTGGTFIGSFESLDQRKRKFHQNYPYTVAKFVIIFDFLYKRVWPKLPILKKIYFALSQGNNRVISKAECLGRLSFCGFTLIRLQEIDNKLYFITKKTKLPSRDKNPSYGILFKQRRVGKGGKVIYVYKFRTMFPYSEYIHKYVLEKSNLDERGKIAKDYRITRWGKFIRRYYLDELPMLINVIKGDLKLLGVRPLSEAFFNTYPGDLKQERIKYKAGLIPPLYMDLPHSIEEVWESEKRYLARYKKHPLRTDLVYFFKSLRNILFHHAKNE